MRAVLDTPFRDVAAGQLCFRTDAPVQPSLAVLRLPALGGTLELHLLGASHQALLRTDQVEVTELVACGAGAPGLPARDHRVVGPLACRFQARILSGAAGHAAALRHRYQDAPDALVGAFPGSSDALTVLAAEVSRHRCRWRTWHVYPQTDEVAMTTTTVTTAPVVAPPAPANPPAVAAGLGARPSAVLGRPLVEGDGS